MKRVAFDLDRRDHRNLLLRQIRGEGMFLENRGVAPAMRTIKLRDDKTALVETDLVDAILVTIECEYSAVAAKTDAFERFKHEVGRQLGVRRFGQRGLFQARQRPCVFTSITQTLSLRPMILRDRFGSTAFLTAVAMIAFAANSLLCRMALGAGTIDAASFTTIRVASGAIVLTLIALPGRRTSRGHATDFIAVAMLFLYMAFFSFAYLSLAAGTGALILFGTVQLTMFAAALVGGERFNGLSWLGLAFALAGLIYLVSPGLSAPDPLGAVLMTVAGIAWGFYSLRGRQAVSALRTTANCFIFSVPLVLIVSIVFLGDLQATPRGVALAIASGTVASGLGYVIWFAALPGLTAGRAATVQLSVPVIAAFGGILLLSEAFSSRLLIASVATLSGIWLVLAQRVRRVTAE